VPRITPALAAAVVALVVLPARAAAAPVLWPLKPCYDAAEDTDSGREQVLLAGTGFTPGARVDVAIDGSNVVSSVAIDADGNLPAGTINAPFVDSGQRPFTVTVTEKGNLAQSVAAQALVTRLGVTVKPMRARAGARVRFRGAGFTAGGPVYLHYLHRGKVRRTVRLVRRPEGPCGTFEVRRPQFPFTPAVGRWWVRVDQLEHYVAQPDDLPYVRLRIDVAR
jgi:hypothetical protein